MTENVLLNFTADWCEPCQWVKPILQEVMGKMGDKVTLQVVDIDSNPDMARQYHVLSVPTLVLLKDSAEVWRMRGFDTAEKMTKIIGEYI